MWVDEAEYNAMLQDALRYRWLRDPLQDLTPVYYSRDDFGSGLLSHTALDAAIDAARGDGNG